jgi:Single-strand binding protein family
MFNNVPLIGHLSSDAESRTTRNNSTLDGPSLATKRTWKNREPGDGESPTTRDRCVAFGRRPTTRPRSRKAPSSKSSAVQTLSFYSGCIANRQAETEVDHLVFARTLYLPAFDRFFSGPRIVKIRLCNTSDYVVPTLFGSQGVSENLLERFWRTADYGFWSPGVGLRSGLERFVRCM